MNQITTTLENTNEQFVYRSNALIESSYRLSQVEQMLLIFATKEAKQTQTGYWLNKPCVIRVQDYAKAFGITDTSNLYRDLKHAMNKLYERSVYSIYSKNGHEYVEKTRWITQQTYSDNAGYLSLSFAPEVVPFLLDIEKNFTRYDLLQIGKFTSGYAVRLFEILKKNEVIGHCEITIEWLRTHLQLGDLYPLYSNFRMKVIDESIKQINKHSDIKVTYKQIKRGRSVHSFKFIIQNNEPKQPKPPKQTQARFNLPQPGESAEAFRLRQNAALDNQTAAHQNGKRILNPQSTVKPSMPNQIEEPFDYEKGKANLEKLKKQIQGKK